MLIEFSVENFRSFKEKQTFSLLASKDKSLLGENTFLINQKYNLLKTAMIYGANASGKSNLFNALVFFLSFTILSGPRGQNGEPIKAIPFMLDVQKQHEPSSFEIMFLLSDSENTPIRYRYGLKLNKAQILEEYLFAVNKTREVNLFERENQDITANKTWFSEYGTFNPKIVRKNASYLSICAQNNGEISSKIIKYFQNLIVLSGINIPSIFTFNSPKKSENLTRVTKFLQFADIQIKDLKKRKVPVNFDDTDPEFSEFLKRKFPNAQEDQILYTHELYDKDVSIGTFDLPDEEESVGTRKLFDYAGFILSILDKGGILFIDEFDSSLHPIIVENIVKLFNDPCINKNNAQLVISCHAVTLMTNKLFRRDQIWFCEKDKYGASDLYSLLDIDEPVRKDATYNKSYLTGKYGAIPNIDIIRLQMECQS
ncbi:MAG: ATP-binding protein [Treponema sp.]|nr:ATP-binding protein [Treponema sp.]